MKTGVEDMQTKQIRGDAVAEKLRTEIRDEAERLKASGASLRMASVITVDDPVQKSYAESKIRVAESLGIEFDLVALPLESGQAKLEKVIQTLADDSSVKGIMLELPLAADLDLNRALDSIPAHKDVDGLTPRNMGLLYSSRESEALISATAQACVMLAESERSLASTKVAVIGKGRTVGTPLIGMLLNRHATVTVCHSLTSDLASSIKDCEIVFSGTGQAGLLGRHNLVQGQIVIDAGLSMADGELSGDLNSEDMQGFLAAFTPVPNGVGPVTTAVVFRNLLGAVRIQEKMLYN